MHQLYTHNKTHKRNWLVVAIILLTGLPVSGQIVGGNAYLIGDHVEVAIDGTGGHEGTADLPGSHSRGGGTDEVPFGFVANPANDGWIEYNGDFFTAGSPENGFGLEINGTNYSNNGWDAGAITPFFHQIPKAPGTTITYTNEEGCLTVEWEGLVAGARINVKYHLRQDAYFYTTEVTLTNTTGSNLADVYYYRNVDPDNNESIGGTFITQNTIVSQSSPDCIKAQVSAEQFSPHYSYLSLGALGENFKVSHGGFSNRSGSDIWNGTGGLNSGDGMVVTADEAISLAYKTDIPAGGTVNFTYAIVLDAGSLEAAFSSLYFVNYETPTDVGGGASADCNPATVVLSACSGNEILLYVDGPRVDLYDWMWNPVGVENDSVYIAPLEEGMYSVVGVPTQPCLSGLILKTVSIVFDIGPQIYWDPPEAVCDSFDLNTLIYTDEGEGDGEDVNCIFLSEQPSSATQTEPEFEGPWMDATDDVWLMCGDTVTGCYDWIKIELNFTGEGSAGLDTTINLCAASSLNIFLTTFLSDSANRTGYFVDWEDTGLLDEESGVFFAGDTTGTFEFAYVVPGLPPCPNDTAWMTVNLQTGPIAYFEYDIEGYDIGENIFSFCVDNQVNFYNLSTISAPNTIESFYWTFDGMDTSYIDDPFRYYGEPGSYFANLVVTADNGCKSSTATGFEVYLVPEMEVVVIPPTCYEDEDGQIIVREIDQIGPYTLDVSDFGGTIYNAENLDTTNGLGAGFYTVYLEDFTGCSNTDTVELIDPPELIIYSRWQNPSCQGGFGYAVVDSVAGESFNNPITYTWDPNPAGISGTDADSSYQMVAGDYTVTVTDSKGCVVSEDFTLIDPPKLYFTECGWDTAYCRLHAYQSGNGYVYAAAAGGVPNYDYEWTYLADGSTHNNSTWGSRSAGDHIIRVTDAAGCVLTKQIYVDSVNPIAEFTMVSAELNENCEGTADVMVEFTNHSQYYANPNNPIADTLFLWDLDVTETYDWQISTSVYEKFTGVYGARGEAYQVEACLIAFNKNGCSDTTCKIIKIWEPPVLEPINIFSPDGDGQNDLMTFWHRQKGIADFQCIIVNRWGTQVGEINSIAAGWDGNDYDGEPCSEGVYFYTYTATAENGEEFSGQGSITLTRGR